jgi:chromate transporter
MLAAAQFLPGAIGINIGAYTGFHVSIAGAYIAVLGMVTPQIAVITVIARVFEAFKKNVIAARIFAGLTPAAAGLLSAAGFNIWKISLYNGGGGVGGVGDSGGAGGWGENFFIDIRAAIIFAIFFILIHKIKKIHPAFFIASAGVLGVVLKL